MMTKSSLHIDVESRERENPEVEEDEGMYYLGNMTRLNIDDLEEVEEDASYLSVVRRTLAAPKSQKEDWRRISIFQTLVCCGKETRKLITDSDSCMKVVSESTVERLKLPTKPHPEPSSDRTMLGFIEAWTLHRFYMV
ncbi:hypothetical protein ACH5RR_007207 [Cinchona calisaya]|uniref:Uncharacterized protein n=1 Tax=Cinchona calisaya TaxID=153742 RepID=A0ABD3AR60_9GENT